MVKKNCNTIGRKTLTKDIDGSEAVIYVACTLLIWRNLPDMGDPGVAPFGLLMVHGRGSGMSWDLPVAGPWLTPCSVLSDSNAPGLDVQFLKNTRAQKPSAGLLIHPQ